MSRAKQVLGKDLMLFINGKAIALATSCKLGVSAETTDTQSKDSGVWNEKGVKKIGWNCSSDNVFSADKDINGYDALFALMIAAEPVDIAFGIPSNAGTEYPANGWSLPPAPYTGKAIITSLEATGADGDKATFSTSLEGTGALNPGDSAASLPAYISTVTLNGENLTNEVPQISVGNNPSNAVPVIINGKRLSSVTGYSVNWVDTDSEYTKPLVISSKSDTKITASLSDSSLSSTNISYIAIKGDGVVLFEWGTKDQASGGGSGSGEDQNENPLG